MNPVVIIPALNPDGDLLHLVEALQKSGLPIVIINDGSRQEYRSIFETLKTKYHCDVCTHDKNEGKGAALKTGIQYAARIYPNTCGYVTADADGQHAPEDILKIADLLTKNPQGLILGTRDFQRQNIPAKSKWGNRLTSWVFRLSTGKRCSDTQTGLRGIPKKFTETCLEVTGNRYEYEMNVLMEVASKASLITTPIKTIYRDGNRSTHFHPVKDSFCIYYHILKFSLLKYSLSAMTSAVVDISLFTLLTHFVFGVQRAEIFVATIVARLFSGMVNFMINKHWVFQSANKSAEEARKYLALFLSQMMLSSLLVTVLSILPIPLMLLKIVVDTVLFIFSYLIQKNMIFKHQVWE